MNSKRILWNKIKSWFPVFLFPCLFSFLVVYTNVAGFSSNQNANTAAVVLNPYISVEDYNILRGYEIPDLMPLVNLVATKFKTIVVPILDAPPDRAKSLFLLPNAVAEYNAETASPQNVSQLTVSLYLTPDLADSGAILEQFSFLGLLVDIANEVSPQTVTSVSIFLTREDLFLENLEDTLSQIRAIFPRPAYSLGLSFITEEFERAMINNTDILRGILQTTFSSYVDHVIFSFNEINDDLFFHRPVKSVLRQALELVKSCRQFVRDNTNGSLTSFLVKVGWPDTSQQGRINYSRTVEFWETMEAMATAEDLSVIFLSAFDQGYENKPPETTHGWWRLVENSSYTNTSQYVFETKKEIALREDERTIHSWMARIEKIPEFDRKWVSTKFSPYVLQSHANNPHRFNKSLVPVLIHKIATEFGGLFLAHYDLDSFEGIETSTIPDAVAKFNLNATSPLRLMMSVDLTMEAETNLIIDLILKTNRIYPGTVVNVLIFGLPTEEYVTELRQKLNPEGSKTGILVGLYLPVGLCAGSETTFLMRATVPMKERLSWVDFVHFSYIPGDEFHPSYIFGVDRVLSQVKTQFENCKRRVAYNVPQVEVGFETGYADSVKSVDDDYLSLVLFWGEMNDWAQKTNTNIAFSGAFDVPFKGQDDKLFGHLGWWKVVQDSEDQNNLVFIDKRQVALTKLQETLPPEAVTEELARFGLITSLVITVIIFLAAVPISYLLYRRAHKMKPQENEVNYTVDLELQNDDDTLPAAAFIPEMSTLIGTGNYGLIYKCFMVHFKKEVAVKTVRTNDISSSDDILSASLKNLLSEIKIMRHVGHHENILQLLGVSPKGTLYMVTEYCENGSLLSYLRSTSVQGKVPSNYELLQYSWEISNGMAFLAEKDVIHGDLSARNVLLNGVKTCKIADFGLSRKLDLYEKYMKKSEEPLPWRWMAYESLTNLEFSLKSDVWSMGVTFWEVFSLGKLPFPELAWNATYCDRLMGGLRLGKPQLAEENVYNIFLSCWSLDSGCRPHAVDIRQSLQQLKSQDYSVIV